MNVRPGFNEAMFSYAILLARAGDYERAWPLFESRWNLPGLTKPNFSQPAWSGQSVDGKRILIYSEQGLGDSIQFIRYAAMLVERGAEVIVECRKELVDLLRTAIGVTGVFFEGEPLPPFDLHVAMLSQPGAFKTTIQTIPGKVPYLFANPARRHTWRDRLGNDHTRLRVGLTWAGNADNVTLRKRRVALEQLLPVVAVENVDFFSLQIGSGSEQIGRLPLQSLIADHTMHIKDFADTAAFMAELDLIISVDTAVAHLAGALGCSVWTLLPFVSDWRWGLEGENTPWYPTMRLFRQPAPGDWASVIQKVAGELKHFVVERPRPCPNSN
jgi:hypothetical protein